MKITIKDLGAGTGQIHGLGRSGKRVSKAAGRTRGQHPRTTMRAMLGGVGRSFREGTDSEALTTSSKTRIWGAGKPTAVRAPRAPRHVSKLSLSMTCSWLLQSNLLRPEQTEHKNRHNLPNHKRAGQRKCPTMPSVTVSCHSLTPGHSSLFPRAHWGSDAWAGSAGYWDELRRGQQAWA